MGATNGVGGVDVGLGKHPNPSDGLAAGGTAILHFSWLDAGALMGAHGQVLQQIVADFPLDPSEQAATTVQNQAAVKNGFTRVSFTNARIMSVQNIGGGAAEVMVHYLNAHAGPLLPGATFTTSRSGIKTRVSTTPDMAFKAGSTGSSLPSIAFSTSKSGIKTVSIAGEVASMQALTPGVSSRAVSTKGISGI
jgi:hypothetical protein